MRNTIGITIIAAALLTAQWWWNDRQTVRATQLEAQTAALAAVQKQLERLERRSVAQSAPPAAAPPTAPVGRAPAAPRVAPEPELDEPETIAADVPSEPRVSPQARVAQRYVEESQDPEWSEPTSDRIADELTLQLPSGSSIADIDCRRTVCRVEVRHDHADGHDAILDLAMSGEFFWKGGGAFQLDHDPSGQTLTVAYLGREGVDLWGDAAVGATAAGGESGVRGSRP